MRLCSVTSAIQPISTRISSSHFIPGHFMLKRKPVSTLRPLLGPGTYAKIQLAIPAVSHSFLNRVISTRSSN
jgi:hypothetical protein